MEPISHEVQETTHERTLVILKPDAVERRLVGAIVARFESLPFEIIAMKLLRAHRMHLDKHFPNTKEWIRNMGTRACERLVKELNMDPAAKFGTSNPDEVGRKIAEGCRQYYASGQLCALVLQGHDVVRAVRALIGNTLPSKAAKGTIRGDFGEPEDMGKLILGAARNLIHASDSPAEAEREIAVWFSPAEILSAEG